ncbi:MAG: hypothetical protein J6C66_00210 [Prevotella sp.]|nr:hypothetical protein [Prevotella sp.]MBO5314574.1 hypothetical protein [Prevotella sp.]
MEQSTNKENSKCTCKCKRRRNIIIIVAIIVAAAVFALTTPNRGSHKKAITQEIENAITKAAQARGLTEQQLGDIGQATKNGMTHVYLENTLKVDNYLFFNLATIDRNNNAEPMSLGILGQVIILRAQDINYGINRALDIEDRLLDE